MNELIAAAICVSSIKREEVQKNDFRPEIKERMRISPPVIGRTPEIHRPIDDIIRHPSPRVYPRMDWRTGRFSLVEIR